jgi:uncharacterized protein (TIGR03437 family)
MKSVFTSIRISARPILFAALLLAMASAGLSRWGVRLWRESASAQETVAVVNAGSFVNDANKALTPDTIAAAFGNFVTQNNQIYAATSLPLPTTLGGVRATINNVPVGLFFVSTQQINLLIPSNIQDGTATIVVSNSDNSTRSGTFNVVRSAPGLFSANATGKGVAAAVTTTDGVNFLSVFNPDRTERDVSAGTTQTPNFLVLFATGLRYTPAQNPGDGNGVAEAVTVTFQGVPAQVAFAGPAPGLEGADQINVVIPPEMAGLGSVNVVVTANSRSSNAVTIKLGGPMVDVKPTPIALGETKNGELTVADQIQVGEGTNLYFFDAYDFMTTVPNTPIAIDLRSSQFDAGLLFYKVQADNSLTPIGFDDDFGGMGDGDFVNDNALILFIAQEVGRYVIFATSADKQPLGRGAYTLKLSTITAQQLNYGQSVNDGAIANTDLQTSGGDFVDVYWFVGANGDNVRVNMNSSAFDPLLFLQSNDNEFFAFDDNSGGGVNAQVTSVLSKSQIHIIVATPFEPNVFGSYTLSLNKLNNLGPTAANAEFEAFRAPGRLTRGERTKAQPLFRRPGGNRIIE